MQLSRRDMLKLAGLGAAGAAGLTLPLGREVSGSTISLLPTSQMPKPYANDFALQKVAKYRTGIDPVDKRPVRFYDLYARAGKVQLTNGGPSTMLLGYTDSETGGPMVPGPMIKVDQGTKIVMTMHNELPEKHPTFNTELKLSTHLHGSASLPQYDGYANDSSEADHKKHYHYPNHQEARTLWYHDHGVHYTAQNAYSGLAAQYHLHDDFEKKYLPQGEYDVAVTLSDIAFKADGSQLYDDRSQSGLWGDVILVNGVPWPRMKVKPQIYRFRFLNASISRSYRPTTSPEVPMHVVATDGGLVGNPEPVKNWRHGNAERYEVLIDFRKMRGQTVYLNNLSNPNNRDFDNTNKIMRFDVLDQEPDTNAWTWEKLAPLGVDDKGRQKLRTSQVMKLKAGESKKTRTINVERKNGMWVLNGQTWHDVENSGFKNVLGNPGLGDVEIWDIVNNSGGWFHPVHIHLVDFQVISRNGSSSAVKNYERGPKDVIYVGENEKVRVLMRFGDPAGIPAPYGTSAERVKNEGKYMIHCHNLVHEDHDMMGQFSVGDPNLNNPVSSDPPVPNSDPARF